MEAGVQGVGLGALLQGPLARVLDGQGAGDDEHFTQAVLPFGGEDHAADARVHGQAGEAPPEGGEAALGVHRPQFEEGVVGVLDGTRVGGVEEGEVVHRAEAQGVHAQDHGGEVGAQDLRVGVRRAGEVVVLRVEADAHPGAEAAATPLALVGAGPGDGFDGQALDLGAGAVAADAGVAGVHHVADAGDGEGGLGDVGGEDDAPGAALGVEDAVLFLLRQARVQGQDLAARRMVLAQGLGGLADLPFAGEENEDVAGAVAGQFVHRLHHALLQIAVLGVQVLALEGAVAHLHRVAAPFHVDHRGAAEMAGEAVRVDGGGGDDELEVGAARQQPFQIAEEEVDVEAALVRLVDDEGVVLFEQAVALGLGQEDAVGHEFDEGVRAGAVGEAHLVAHQAAVGVAQFLL